MKLSNLILQVFHFICLPLSISCRILQDPYIVPFGPKNGDSFNSMYSLCSSIPFPLDINFNFGNSIFSHVFICKGGILVFAENGNVKRLENMEDFTKASISAFWADVDYLNWKNPFLDESCQQVYNLYNYYHSSNKSQNVVTDFYFGDPFYNDPCNVKDFDIDTLIRSDDSATAASIFGRDPLPSERKNFRLLANIFKRVDRTSETLETLTKLLKQTQGLPNMEMFEATWSFVVTWFRTPLSFNGTGWLSQQTVLVCDEKMRNDSSGRCFVIWVYESAGRFSCEQCPKSKISMDPRFYIEGNVQ